MVDPANCRNGEEEESRKERDPVEPFGSWIAGTPSRTRDALQNVYAE